MTAFQEIWAPWLIGPFLWFAGIAGMGSVAYVLLKWIGVEEKRKELSWTLLISMALALVFVIADLSRPWNVASAIMSAVFGGTFGWTRSWMAVGIVLLLTGLLLTLLLALRNSGVKVLAPLTDAKWFDALLALVGIAITVYSGFLIAAAPGVPFWNTPLLPVLWIISASLCAVALVKLMIHHEAMSKAATRYGVALDAAELLAIFALINLALYGGSVAAKQSAHTLAYGELAPIFWIGLVGIGVVIPLLLGLIMLKKENKYLGIAAAVLALIGALLLRVLVLQAGIFEPII
ncbi:Formate-dependent nitrite reductase, membrane component [Pyrobaculum oguniense TE7]|uniref:Formate-dependent nitrite reductase, membrane component n=1 Tax=Pyrobaculum oguniense (strain DSM 13380 / JCM 10595 / TE7) TaxID=698757 RepID=H6QAG8_PYROT|nr:Formate-dependent nitrite reductase, membrane component [Pyrobaculum oguniense TE7]